MMLNLHSCRHGRGPAGDPKSCAGQSDCNCEKRTTPWLAARRMRFHPVTNSWTKSAIRPESVALRIRPWFRCLIRCGIGHRVLAWARVRLVTGLFSMPVNPGEA
jgi:hypothetical protein